MAVIKDLEELSTDIDTARVGFFNEYKFGYLGEVNAYHKTSYPLMVLTPPMSVFTNPYKNDEEFSLRFYLYKPVEIVRDDDGGQTLMQINTTMLERSFDALQSQFVSTMDVLLKNNEHKYIMNGSWNIERVSDEHNDKLVGLVIDIKLQKFSHCLPLSN